MMKQKDSVREEFLKKIGLHIIHFTARDVLYNLEWVLEETKRFCGKISKRMAIPPSLPLERGGK